jgi:hypothetical protein
MKPFQLLSNQHWIKQGLRTSESLTTNIDKLTIWKLINHTVLIRVWKFYNYIIFYFKLLLWDHPPHSTLFPWFVWSSKAMLMNWNLARFMLIIFEDKMLDLCRPGRFFRWREEVCILRKLELYASLRPLHLIPALLFYLLRIGIVQLVWTDRMLELRKFRTWFQSFFTGSTLGF